MTIKEIASLCNVAESTIRGWITSAESADISAKVADAKRSKRPADLTLGETISIIRAGGNNTLADLLMQNVNQTALATPQDNRLDRLESMVERLVTAVTVMASNQIAQPAKPQLALEYKPRDYKYGDLITVGEYLTSQGYTLSKGQINYFGHLCIEAHKPLGKQGYSSDGVPLFRFGVMSRLYKDFAKYKASI